MSDRFCSVLIGSELSIVSSPMFDRGEAANSLTVTIAPGVTTGELSKFFTDNNVCFKTDAILDKATYGGLIAAGCHGVGKDQLAVSDYVKGMSIVGANGEEAVYTFPSDDQDNDNALKCNMGLFGVMTSITMEVKPMVIVKVENDFSYTVEDLFYNPTALKKLYEDNWSLEIFWFPFNNLSWPQLIALFYFRCPEQVSWEPKHDKLWIRKINPVDVPDEPTPNQVEYDIKEVQDAITTGFGRSSAPYLNKNEFLIPSFLKAGFEMVQTFNATTRFEPMNKAIHYQSFIDVMPVLDMEFAFNADPDTFSRQVEAMQAAIDITKKYY
ncbi:FAD linked oxidase domain-containing [Paramuricea clavata]|uniref:FAD linked oxidase domain-containing n=1 Tax=Paramuricea clavata TaxID=317549 RepID=A0A6S7IN82_PARCT|nr:FAD linked oxidase domain-containing [Paramuricea clavata]